MTSDPDLTTYPAVDPSTEPTETTAAPAESTEDAPAMPVDAADALQTRTDAATQRRDESLAALREVMSDTAIGDQFGIDLDHLDTGDLDELDPPTGPGNAQRPSQRSG